MQKTLGIEVCVATFEVFSAIAKALAMLAVLPLAIGIVERKVTSQMQRALIVATLFSGTALVTMATPVVLMPGLVVDGRSTIVGMGAALGGPVSAVIVPLVAGSYRYFYIGGIGALPGTIDILLSGLFGFLWGRFLIKNHGLTISKLFFGGLLMSLPIVIAIGMLPSGPREMLAQAAPMLIAADIIGALVVGLLFEQERQLIEHGKKLVYEAHHDSLTGVANRHLMLMRFKELVTVSSGRICSVALFDIDYFKQVNDRYGHATGDDVLRRFSEILKHNARDVDVVVRMGGEEFMILMPENDTVAASQTATRVLAELRNCVFRECGEDFRLTVSAGVFSFIIGDVEFRKIYEVADQRLYRAKQEGRDRVVSRDALTLRAAS